MYVINVSFGVGLISIGAFMLLGHFDILQYSPAFPIITFGLTLMVLSLREYVKVRGDRYE